MQPCQFFNTTIATGINRNDLVLIPIYHAVQEELSSIQQYQPRTKEMLDGRKRKIFTIDGSWPITELCDSPRVALWTCLKVHSVTHTDRIISLVWMHLKVKHKQCRETEGPYKPANQLTWFAREEVDWVPVNPGKSSPESPDRPEWWAVDSDRQRTGISYPHLDFYNGTFRPTFTRFNMNISHQDSQFLAIIQPRKF